MKILKKLIIFTFLMTLPLFSQFTKIWEKSAGLSYPWFVNDGNTTSIAYDSLNNFLYVLSLKGGNYIFVLDPSNGNVIDTLNASLISGGSSQLNLIRVDESGVIYACNLASDNSEPFKIYRWANKDAVPTVACSLHFISRYGDALSVVGKGVNTLVYSSGSSTNDIKLFSTTNGISFNLLKSIPLLYPSLASGSITPVNNTLTSTLWLKNSTFPAYKINQTGNIIDSIPQSILPKLWMKIINIKFENKEFISAIANNDPSARLKFPFFNISYGTNNTQFLGYGSLSNSYNPNSNLRGDIAVKNNNDGSLTFFCLITNNGLGAFKTQGFIDFSINMKNTIARGNFIPNTTDKVYIRGVFNNWSLRDTLEDIDNDSIYSKLVNIGDLGTKEFKFYYKKSDGSENWESDPNRSFVFNNFFSSFYGGYFNFEVDSINWCNLQWPQTITANTGDTNQVYARVYSANITPNPGSSNRIKAWIGLNNINNHPSNSGWNWTPATFNTQSGNDDEYSARIGYNLTSGTYYFASRFQCDGQAFQYGGYNISGGGFWDGNSNISGVLSINSSTICKSISISGDWNIVSVPLWKQSMKKDSIFKNSVSNAFGFNGSYFQTDTLVIGSGYWLKFPNPDTIQICGLPNQSNSISVSSGWNLIGILDKNISAASVTSNPPNIISSQFFGYEYGYTQPAILQSGKGFWVKASQNGSLILPSSINANLQRNAFLSFKSDWIKIKITDSKDFSNTLYLTNDNTDVNLYELPPVPPVGIPDIRFLSNRLVEISDNPKTIIFNSLVYPIRITSDGNELLFKDNINGNFLNSTIKKGETITINNPSINSVFVSIVEIPNKFSLIQNYPNPFNPSTIIKFGLAGNVKVSLKVYNQIGQMVTELINKELESGYHQVVFDATNFAGGIYFYEIIAGNFREVKKMLLIK